MKEKESGMEKALREVSEEKREKERDREKEGETYLASPHSLLRMLFSPRLLILSSTPFSLLLYLLL